MHKTGDHTIDEPKVKLDKAARCLIPASADNRHLAKTMRQIHSCERHHTKTGQRDFGFTRSNTRDVTVFLGSRLSPSFYYFNLNRCDTKE